MAARLAAEKGVEYLAQALPSVIAEFPRARLLFVGPHSDVVGEDAYASQLKPLIDRLGSTGLSWNPIAGRWLRSSMCAK